MGIGNPGTVLSLGTLGVGALGGRVVAEIRNALSKLRKSSDDDKDKKKPSPPASLRKAAEFGAMMGKVAFNIGDLPSPAIGALLGAGVGGGGTALYDLAVGNKNKLRRALMGAGLGGAAGAASGAGYDYFKNKGSEAPSSKKPKGDKTVGEIVEDTKKNVGDKAKELMDRTPAELLSLIHI